MPRARTRAAWLVAGLALAAMAAIAWWSRARPATSEPIGLFTTLPILWSDSAGLEAELNPRHAPHWARAVLARHGSLQPLDLLSTGDGSAPLAQVRRLVIAQPRVLTPQENVALDDWLRGGGRLLLLADPALTEHSDLPLADPRRPQAVVLLSPILTRWGLELRFDDRQPAGETIRAVLGKAVPVNLPGQFATRGQAACRLWADGLAVTCRIGRGRLVALADAAVLERDDPSGARQAGFDWLLDAAFAAR